MTTKFLSSVERIECHHGHVKGFGLRSDQVSESLWHFAGGTKIDVKQEISNWKIHTVEKFTYQTLGSDLSTVTGNKNDYYKIQDGGYIW